MPVGVLDSGVGGLSVLRAIRATQPSADLIYYADQAHLPYGPRPAAEIRHLTETGVDWLLAQGCEAVVLACNTASAPATSKMAARSLWLAQLIRRCFAQSSLARFVSSTLSTRTLSRSTALPAS